MKAQRPGAKRDKKTARPRNLPVRAVSAANARGVKGGMTNNQATTAQKAAEKVDSYIRS